MKYAVLVARLIFGAWFVFNGLLYWQPNMPMGKDPVAVELLAALMRSDVLLMVKLVELITGLLILANLFVPLALIVAFPVTLMVAYVCLVLEWPQQRPLIGGAATLGVHLFMLFAYRRYYLPMLTLKSYAAGDPKAPS